MRLGSRRRRPIRPRLLLLLVALALLGMSVGFEHSLVPTLLEFAEADAVIAATRAVNSAVGRVLGTGVDYRDLVYVDKDDRGRVTFLQPNTVAINRLATDATLAIQEELDRMRLRKLEIPLGQAFGSRLVAGYGPRVPITVMPVGTVDVTVHQKFEDAGINQTRHAIYLDAVATVEVIVPLLMRSAVVHTRIPVADVVIVGDVPLEYLNLDFGGTR